MNNIFKKLENSRTNLILLFFLSYSFLGSVNQGAHVYDGYHWGLVASNANDFLSGKLPYKDFFVHYGFLTILFHAVAMKLFGSVYSLIVLTALIYCFGIYLLSYLIKKIVSKNYVLLLIFILFFMQPFVFLPWHSYLVFIFSLLSIICFLNKNIYSYFFFGFFIQLGCLSSESYKLLSFIIIIFSFILIYKINKKNNQKFIYIISVTLGYCLPLILFISYLIKFDLYADWSNHKLIPKVFSEMINLTYYQMLKNFILNYLSNSINILSAPHFIFGLVIILICLFNFIDYIKKKEINFNLLFISAFSLLMNYTLVFKHESFRFFLGPIIGIIVLFFYIHKIKKKMIVKYISIFSLIFISVISNPFEKGHSNKNFIHKSVKNESIESDKLIFFQKMKYKKDTWEHLLQLDKILKKVSNRCFNVKYFFNATSDHFYYLILSDEFQSIQKIPGYSENILNKYYDSLNSYYDADLYKNLKLKVDNQLVIIIRENKIGNLKIHNKAIKLKDYYSFNLKFSHKNKNKKLLIPN